MLLFCEEYMGTRKEAQFITTVHDWGIIPPEKTKPSTCVESPLRITGFRFGQHGARQFVAKSCEGGVYVTLTSLNWTHVTCAMSAKMEINTKMLAKDTMCYIKGTTERGNGQWLHNTSPDSEISIPAHYLCHVMLHLYNSPTHAPASFLLITPLIPWLCVFMSTKQDDVLQFTAALDNVTGFIYSIGWLCEKLIMKIMMKIINYELLLPFRIDFPPYSSTYCHPVIVFFFIYLELPLTW